MYRRLPLVAVTSLGLIASSAAAQQIETQRAPAPTGPSGEAADQSLGMAIMSATVEGDGTLRGIAGVVGAAKVSTGNYTIRFVRSVAGCMCVGSPGTSDGSAIHTSGALAITVNCPFGDPENVRVWSRIGGADADFPFHLIVFCPW